MLMRKSMIKDSMFSATRERFHKALSSAYFGDPNIRMPVYVSREYEWPWMLEHAPFDSGPVLDVGCDIIFALAAMEMGANVTCLWTDFDFQRIGDIAKGDMTGKRKWQDAFWKYRHKWTGLIGYPESLPDIFNGHFQTIYCTSTLEHVPPEHYQAWIDGLDRVLAPGGRLAITTDFYMDYPGDPICGYGHPDVGYNHNLFRALEVQGFQIENPSGEYPWSANWDRLIKDDDVVKMEWEYGKVCVYGLTCVKT